MLKKHKTLKTLPSSSWSIISGGEKEEPPLKAHVNPDKSVTFVTTIEPCPNTKVDFYDKYNPKTGENTIGVYVTYVFD